MYAKFIISTILAVLPQLKIYSQTTYYISSTGKDSNKGTTSSSPWKTIREIKSGNTYLLKRGDIFPMNIRSIKASESNAKITISAYGQGNKPVLSLYKKINANAWSIHSPNIWKVDISDKSNYTGFIHENGNVGFLKIDDKIYGNRVSKISTLSRQWDFYSDNKVLYVYSTQTIKDVKSFQVACNVAAISLSNKISISNIAINGTGGHAISGQNNEDIALSNIDISEIGGSLLLGYGDGSIRYGNGIEFFNGCKNCIVENCSISQTYDTAITMQGNSTAISFNNVVIKNNLISKNEQSFEVWIQGGGPGFTKCKFINNKCYDAGYGWSHMYRPIKYQGVHLLSYDLKCINSDLIIEENTFFRAKSGLYFYRDEPNYVSRNNNISLNINTPIRSLAPGSKSKISDPSDFKDFVTSTGYERGSTFTVIPGVIP